MCAAPAGLFDSFSSPHRLTPLTDSTLPTLCGRPGLMNREEFLLVTGRLQMSTGRSLDGKIHFHNNLLINDQSLPLFVPPSAYAALCLMASGSNLLLLLIAP